MANTKMQPLYGPDNPSLRLELARKARLQGWDQEKFEKAQKLVRALVRHRKTLYSMGLDMDKSAEEQRADDQSTPS